MIHDSCKKLVLNCVGTTAIFVEALQSFFHSFINISACKLKVIEMFKLFKVWCWSLHYHFWISME